MALPVESACCNFERLAQGAKRIHQYTHGICNNDTLSGKATHRCLSLARHMRIICVHMLP